MFCFYPLWCFHTVQQLLHLFSDFLQQFLIYTGIRSVNIICCYLFFFMKFLLCNFIIFHHYFVWIAGWIFCFHRIFFYQRILSALQCFLYTGYYRFQNADCLNMQLIVLIWLVLLFFFFDSFRRTCRSGILIRFLFVCIDCNQYIL